MRIDGIASDSVRGLRGVDVEDKHTIMIGCRCVRWSNVASQMNWDVICSQLKHRAYEGSEAQCKLFSENY